MPTNIYGFTALTGGGTGALDAIDGAGLADLDMAMGMVSGVAYFYVLDADSAATETSPDIIAPDANAGNIRWILQSVVKVKELKTAPAIDTGVLTINCNLGTMFAASLNAAITSFTVTNIPAAGTLYGFMLELTADGTPRAVTWTFQSVAVKWAGGPAPTLTSTNAKKDAFVFYTWDAGTTWIGAVVGQNY